MPPLLASNPDMRGSVCAHIVKRSCDCSILDGTNKRLNLFLVRWDSFKIRFGQVTRNIAPVVGCAGSQYLSVAPAVFAIPYQAECGTRACENRICAPEGIRANFLGYLLVSRTLKDRGNQLLYRDVRMHKTSDRTPELTGR